MYFTPGYDSILKALAGFDHEMQFVMAVSNFDFERL
jgi:hypothetical protein